MVAKGLFLLKMFWQPTIHIRFLHQKDTTILTLVHESNSNVFYRVVIYNFVAEQKHCYSQLIKMPPKDLHILIDTPFLNQFPMNMDWTTEFLRTKRIWQKIRVSFMILVYWFFPHGNAAHGKDQGHPPADVSRNLKYFNNPQGMILFNSHKRKWVLKWV